MHYGSSMEEIKKVQWKWKSFCKFERNPCFPEFRTIRLELEMQVFNENEILFCSKTNPCGSFPEFRTVRGGLRKGKAVFRHFVMKLSEPKVLQVNLSVRGRANQSRNLSCSQFWLSWGPSKILQPLSGGCGSRLSICKDQEKKTNTETAMLSIMDGRGMETWARMKFPRAPNNGL